MRRQSRRRGIPAHDYRLTASAAEYICRLSIYRTGKTKIYLCCVRHHTEPRPCKAQNRKLDQHPFISSHAPLTARNASVLDLRIVCRVCAKPVCGTRSLRACEKRIFTFRTVRNGSPRYRRKGQLGQHPPSSVEAAATELRPTRDRVGNGLAPEAAGGIGVPQHWNSTQRVRR
jgi:hypothetical protein